MRQQEVSRTAIEREFDRRGWAGRQKASFDVNVTGCGEAIQGPYWFGRAYEEPPEFTWSGASRKAVEGIPPFLTVGVSEWIRDAAGMYVGAYLWFKVRGAGSCPPMASYSTSRVTAFQNPQQVDGWEELFNDGIMASDGSDFSFTQPGIYRLEFTPNYVVLRESCGSTRRFILSHRWEFDRGDPLIHEPAQRHDLLVETGFSSTLFGRPHVWHVTVRSQDVGRPFRIWLSIKELVGFFPYNQSAAAELRVTRLEDPHHYWSFPQ